jgi:hypothetical protein
MLNLWNVTLEFHTVTVFILVTLETVFHTLYIGMCEIIYIPSFKCVDAIALLVMIKLEAK